VLDFPAPLPVLAMRAFLLSALLVFMLQGCGLKGPLYLPKPAENNAAKNTESNQAQQKKDAQQQPQQDQQNQ
jgi:predicted small lipoprotein YifL